MKYARDRYSGKVVAAEDASPTRSYACPRPGCGGRVYLPDVVKQIPHFRHRPHEGTLECDQYYPGTGTSGESITLTDSAVEEDPSELGLLLTQQDGRWGLGIRVPEIPGADLGDASLGELRHARVDVYVGSNRLGSISALNLRPGVGVARVDVVPSLQIYRTKPDGSWPRSIEVRRWNLESRGLDAKGVLFRFRSGEWARLRETSGVHYGETLLVLADDRCAIPSAIVSVPLAKIRSDGLVWSVSELRLPNDTVPDVAHWIARLGHEMVRRPWKLALVTLPRGYTEHGEPIFWVDDHPVAILQAPEPAADAIVTCHSGTNTQIVNVKAGQSASAYVCICVHDAGLARLVVAGVRDANLDIQFILRPSSASLISEAIDQAQRLRIQIGSQLLEAWQSISHKVLVSAGELPELIVSLGDSANRARVTIWERGKQRTSRGLDSKGVAKVIGGVLSSAERIEIDAGNLGRIALVIAHKSIEAFRDVGSTDRLAWWGHVVSVASHVEQCRKVASIDKCQGFRLLALRRVDRLTLVRSRIAVRRRLRERGEKS